MNCGFSNFDTLKKHLLAGSSASPSLRFDTTIKLIGIGMAAAIENFCGGRKFFRVANVQEVYPADRCQWVAQRYPIESVASVEIKETETEGFVLQTPSPIVTVDNAAGIINFNDWADAGAPTSQVRFTLTGGYWWEITEPDDVDYPTGMPDGATPLPDDLKLAWLMQCEVIWSKRDKLGLGLVEKPEEQSKLSTLELSPLVKQMLGQFVRYNLV
jgi:hypothetical protein